MAGPEGYARLLDRRHHAQRRADVQVSSVLGESIWQSLRYHEVQSRARVTQRGGHVYVYIGGAEGPTPLRAQVGHIRHARVLHRLLLFDLCCARAGHSPCLAAHPEEVPVSRKLQALTKPAGTHLFDVCSFESQARLMRTASTSAWVNRVHMQQPDCMPPFQTGRVTTQPRHPRSRCWTSSGWG